MANTYCQFCDQSYEDMNLPDVVQFKIWSQKKFSALVRWHLGHEHMGYPSLDFVEGACVLCESDSDKSYNPEEFIRHSIRVHQGHLYQCLECKEFVPFGYSEGDVKMCLCTHGSSMNKSRSVENPQYLKPLTSLFSFPGYYIPAIIRSEIERIRIDAELDVITTKVQEISYAITAEVSIDENFYRESKSECKCKGCGVRRE